jgi:hypothetical protein
MARDANKSRVTPSPGAQTPHDLSACARDALHGESVPCLQSRPAKSVRENCESKESPARFASSLLSANLWVRTLWARPLRELVLDRHERARVRGRDRANGGDGFGMTRGHVEAFARILVEVEQ